MRTCTFILFLLIGWFTSAQETPEKVLIIEKKAKYRIDVFATNQSEAPQNVRIHFKGEGFRKSGFRPITTNIQPKDTIHLTTVYKMKGVNSYLSHQIIYLDEPKKKEEISHSE